METDNSSTTAEVAANGGGVNSPSSRRRSLPSPWASVVRGDSEPNSSPTAAAAAAAPGSSSSPPAEQTAVSDNSLVEGSGSEPQNESADANGDINAARSRRPAWNRPVNGVVEPVSVMGGAVSWPALSETTRAVSRSTSDTIRPVTEGSVSSSQAPIISQPPHRPANSNGHVNSTVNNPMPTRQRSRNRNGGGGGGGGSNSSGSGASHNAFNQPHHPVPPPYPIFEPMVPPVMDASVRGPRPGGVGGSQSHNGNDHSGHRNNSRRGGYGHRPRGDGGYHNNSHGGRRDQDRRDVHPPPPQYMPPAMGYMPPPMPAGAPPFMGAMRILPGQMAFDMASQFYYLPTIPPESYRMPMVPPPPPPPPMPYSPADHTALINSIVKQIDFYFSDENLVKDNFLRARMDDHGWVPIVLIASFRRVETLTTDISLLLEALKYSTVVEVQADKVRRRNEWSKWLLQPALRSQSGFQTAGPSTETTLAASLQNVSLGDGMSTANGDMHAVEVHKQEATGNDLAESSGQSGLRNGENTAEEAHSA